MIIINLVIMSFFKIVSYYILTPLFIPIKIIDRIFENIYFSRNHLLQSDLNLLNNINYSNYKFFEVDSNNEIYINEKKHKIETIIIKIVNYILDLNKFSEIRETIFTLKLLIIIKLNSNSFVNIHQVPHLNVNMYDIINKLDCLFINKNTLLNSSNKYKVLEKQEDQENNNNNNSNNIYSFNNIGKNRDRYYNVEHIYDALIYLICNLSLNKEAANFDYLFSLDLFNMIFNYLLTINKDIDIYYKRINEYFNILTTSLNKSNNDAYGSYINNLNDGDNTVENDDKNNNINNCFNIVVDNLPLNKKSTINLDKKKLLLYTIEELNFNYLIYKYNLLTKEKHDLTSNIYDIEYISSDEEDYIFKNAKHATNSEHSNQDKHIDYKEDIYNFNNNNEVNLQRFNENSLHKLNNNAQNVDNLHKSEYLSIKYKELLYDFNNYMRLNHKNSDLVLHDYKHSIVLILMANILKEINKEEDSIKKCIQAIEKIKTKVENRTYKMLTNLSLYIFSSICFEQILNIIASINELMDENKTKFFIYLKSMDMSLIYNKNIRKQWLQSIQDYVKREYSNFFLKNRLNLDNCRKLFDQKTFLDLKILKHKARIMQNNTNNISKNVVLSFDADFPLLQEDEINNKNKLKNFLNKILSHSKFTKNNVFLSLFNYKHLYVYLKNNSYSKLYDDKVINLYNKYNEHIDINSNKLLANAAGIISKYNYHYKGSFIKNNFLYNKTITIGKNNNLQCNVDSFSKGTISNNFSTGNIVNCNSKNEESFKRIIKSSNINTDKSLNIIIEESPYNGINNQISNNEEYIKNSTINDFIKNNKAANNNIKTYFNNFDFIFIPKDILPIITTKDELINLEFNNENFDLNNPMKYFNYLKDNNNNIISSSNFIKLHLHKCYNKYTTTNVTINNTTSKNKTISFNNYYDKNTRNSSKISYEFDIEDDVFDSNLNLPIDFIPEIFNFNDYPKNNNYLFVFTSIKSKFEFTKNKLKSISTLLMNKQYSLILCIYYKKHKKENENKNLFRLNLNNITSSNTKEENLINKYKQWVNNHIINGKVYVINSFEQLKYVLLSLQPIIVNPYNIKKIRDIYNSLD